MEETIEGAIPPGSSLMLRNMLFGNSNLQAFLWYKKFRVLLNKRSRGQRMWVTKKLKMAEIGKLAIIRMSVTQLQKTSFHMCKMQKHLKNIGMH
jgi:hypothetical protein